MKKEILSIMTVKILLAVIIFAGMGTIIVGGGYIIREYSKTQNSNNKIINTVEENQKEELATYCEIDSDCEGYFSRNTCEVFCANEDEENQKILDRFEKVCDSTLWFATRPECECSDNKCQQVVGKRSYDFLEKKCDGDSCCLDALEYMEENNYKEADKNYKCPDGFKANRLKCESSLSWCEPMEKIQEVSLTTDKTEYQQGEEAELIIQNNSEESLFRVKIFCNDIWNLNPTLQKYEQGKWIKYEWYSYHPFLSGYTCNSIFICDEIKNAKKIDLLLKKDLDTPLEEGKYRVGLTFGKSCKSQERNSYHFNFGLSDEFVVYSNEFEIKKITIINDFTWQTYRNEEFGFEVKYPKKADISKPKTSGFVFIGELPSSGYGYGIAIDAIENSQKLQAHEWYSQYYEKRKKESAGDPFHLSLDGNYITVDNYSAYETSEFGFDHEKIYLYIAYNDYIYKISYRNEVANDPEWKDHKKIIDQILSTFKFIEKKDDANWQTYRNEEFEFQYPEDWERNEKEGVNNGEIDNFRYCDGPGCSYFKCPKAEIAENNSDNKTFPMTKKSPTEYELLCPEKQTIIRDDGLKIETCDFRVYQGEISDYSIKPFCIQSTTRKNCIFLYTITQLNEMTDYKWDQFEPYVGFDINKQLEEEYRDISDQILSTFKFIEK